MPTKTPTARLKRDRSKKLQWLVYWKQDGRNRYFGSYRTRREAESAIVECQSELDGKFGSALGVGWGRFGHHLPAFFAACERKRLRPGTLSFYREKLGYLENRIGSQFMTDLPLKRRLVRDAIREAGNSATWEKGVLRALAAYLNWGHKQEPPLCGPSFTRYIDMEHPREPRHLNFFTVEEARSMLERCKGDARRFPLALMLFAGLRMTEVDRISWELVDFRSRTIYVPEDEGKTAGHMEGLPDALWRWLEGAPTSGPVYKGKAAGIVHNLRKRVPLPEESIGATTRRTFATFACNAFGVETTRKWMRHDAKMTTLETHYLGCVTRRGGRPYIATRAESERYFAG